MAKSLHANVSVGKSGDSQPIYLIQMIPISGTTLYLSSPISFSDTEPAPDQKYNGGVIAQGGVGSIKQEVRLEKGGNVGTISGFKLKLLNTAYYSDIFSGTIWENGSIEMRLIFASEALAYWSNGCIQFKGYINDISWDEKHLNISCVNAWNRRHRQILSDDLMTLSEFPGLPEGNIDKPVPVIYGDWTHEISHENAIPYTDTSGTGIRDNALVYRIDKMPTSSGATNSYDNLLIARHELNQYPEAIDTYDYLRSFNGFIVIVGSMGATSFSSNRCKMTDAILFITQLWIIPTVVDDSTDVTNPGNATDEDETNYADFVDDGANVTYSFNIPELPEMGVADEAIISVQTGLDVLGTYTKHLKMIIYDEDGNAVISEQDVIVNWVYAGYGSQAFTNFLDLSINADDKKTGYLIKFTLFVENSPDASHLYLANVQLIMNPSEIADEADTYLLPLKGREYSYTRSPHTAGDLIETPIGIIESLLRDEMSDWYPDATNIDTRASGNIGFDIIDNHLSTWNCAGELLEAAETLDLIKSIVEMASIGYTQTYDLKETAFTIFQGSTISKTITSADILTNQSGIEQIKLIKTKITDLYNEFYLYYKKNMMTGEYEEKKYSINPGSGSYSTAYTNINTNPSTYWGYCHDLYDEFNIYRTFELNCDWIREDATADLAIRRLIEFLTFFGNGTRYIVEIQTSLDHIDLEIGDQVFMTHDILPNAVSGTNYFLLIGQELSPEKDMLKMKFLDLGAP